MIEIKVTNNKEFLDPIECFGAENGKIFQQYSYGKPTKTYLIGTGCHDRPIMVWWSEDDLDLENEGGYRLSSCSEKDLKSYCDHVKFVEVTGEISVELILNNENR